VKEGKGVGLTDIQKIVNSDFTFAILFIGLLWLVINHIKQSMVEQRAIENEREAQIMSMYQERERDYKEMLNELKEESLNRERELMRHMERITDKLGDVTDALKDVKNAMNRLEEKVDRNVSDLWRSINNIKNNNGGNE
jgi:predicted nuclease with TOPRIM domain